MILVYSERSWTFCSLLLAGYFLLVTFLLFALYFLLVTYCSLFFACYCLFVNFFSLSFARYFFQLLFTRYFLLVIHYFLLVARACLLIATLFLIIFLTFRCNYTPHVLINFNVVLSFCVVTSPNSTMMIRNYFLFIHCALSIKICSFTQIFCSFLCFQVA